MNAFLSLSRILAVLSRWMRRLDYPSRRRVLTLKLQERTGPETLSALAVISQRLQDYFPADLAVEYPDTFCVLEDVGQAVAPDAVTLWVGRTKKNSDAGLYESVCARFLIREARGRFMVCIVNKKSKVDVLHEFVGADFKETITGLSVEVLYRIHGKQHLDHPYRAEQALLRINEQLASCDHSALCRSRVSGRTLEVDVAVAIDHCHGIGELVSEQIEACKALALPEPKDFAPSLTTAPTSVAIKAA